MANCNWPAITSGKLTESDLARLDEPAPQGKPIDFEALARDAEASDLPKGPVAIALCVAMLLGSLLAAHFQPWAWF